MRTARVLLTAVLALVGAVSVSGVVGAVPPSNDTYAGRVVIGSVPFSATVDTTEATTDATDAELNADCGAPATDASVWYEVTPTSSGGLVADVSGSNYSAGVIVATGTPGAFELVACGPGAVGWLAEAGTPYTLLAFDDQLDGGGNGGTLEFVLDVAPPPPTIDVTVSPRAQFTKTGSAIVSGTVVCEGAVEFAFLDVELRQRVGRVVISGFGSTDVTCDGVLRPWSVEVVAFNGTFAGGKAASLTFAVACGAFECGEDFEERTVHLSGGKQGV